MVEIRTARPVDGDTLAGLFAQLGYDEAGGGLAQRLDATLADPAATVLVATINSRVVGAARLHVLPVMHQPGGWCRVTALVVDAAHRRAGVGGALMDAAEGWARAAGCSRIEATSAETRQDAHRFYLTRGYRHTSRHFLKRFA